MIKVNPAIIEKNLKWYQIWQYIMAIFIFVLIPIGSIYLCQMFLVPNEIIRSIGIFFIIQMIILLLSPTFLYEMIKANVGTKFIEVKQETHPEFWDILAGLAKKAGINMPEVFIVDSPTPNAFALQFSPGKSVSCITSGLMDLLKKDKPEKYWQCVEAIMAHEFGHIRYNDIIMLIYCQAYFMVFQMLQQRIVGILIDRGLQKTDELRHPKISKAVFSAEVGGSFAFLKTLSFAYKVLTYLPYVLMMLSTRIMQAKEYRADMFAAWAQGDTEDMQEALITLEKYVSRMPFLPAMMNPFFAFPVSYHWYELPILLFPGFRDVNDALEEPTWERRLRNLFESHPLTYFRVKALEKLKVKNEA